MFVSLSHAFWLATNVNRHLFNECFPSNECKTQAMHYLAIHSSKFSVITARNAYLQE